MVLISDTAMNEPPTPEYGSEAWTLERRNYVGASEVPMIMGFSRFGAAYDVWQSKRGLMEPPDSAAIRRGHYYEPAIAQEYAHRFPEVELVAVPTKAHPEHEWFRATLDRLAIRRDQSEFILEIKKVNPYMIGEYGEDGSDVLPDDKLLQVQSQMMVWQKPYAHVAVDFGHELRVYFVEGNANVQEQIFEASHDFWFNYHLADVPPAITGPNMEMHLRRAYKTHTDKVIKATPEITALIASCIDNRAVLKELEATVKEQKNELMSFIGSNLAVESTAGRVTWSEKKGNPTFDEGKYFAHVHEKFGVPLGTDEQFRGRADSVRAMYFKEPKGKK